MTAGMGRVLGTIAAGLALVLAIAGPASGASAELRGSYAYDGPLVFESAPRQPLIGTVTDVGDPTKKNGFSFRGKRGSGPNPDDIRFSGFRTSSHDGPVQNFGLVGYITNRSGLQHLLLGRAHIHYENLVPVRMEATGLVIFGKNRILATFEIILDRENLTPA